MGRGGQVEVQWDMSPEYPNRPGAKPGDRGHIQGDLLRDALRRAGLRQFEYTEGRGIEYPEYSIEPTRRAGGTTVRPEDRPPPPNPAGPQGHRSVITFTD